MDLEVDIPRKSDHPLRETYLAQAFIPLFALAAAILISGVPLLLGLRVVEDDLLAQRLV